jgi:hypothetical protein
MKHEMYLGYRIGYHNPGPGWSANIWRPDGIAVAKTISGVGGESETLSVARVWFDQEEAKLAGEEE